jgi:hypothetical protein
MIPADLGTTRHKGGDRWRDGYKHFTIAPGDDFEPCLFCRLQFRNKKTGVLGYELNSDPEEGQGQIDIVNAASYEFDIPDQPLPLAEGTWVWDFETFDTADMATPGDTWLTGTMVVLKDYSHD